MNASSHLWLQEVIQMTSAHIPRDVRPKGEGAQMSVFFTAAMRLAAAVVAVGTVVAVVPAARAEAGECNNQVTVTDLGDNGGPYQLRQALLSVCNGGTIYIEPGTINLVAQLWITRSVTVVGVPTATTLGVTINAAADAAFSVTEGSRLTLQTVTLHGGEVKASGIAVVRGALVLNDVTITGFHASTGGGVVAVGGSVTLRGGTSITGNAAAYGGGGIVSYGGGSVMVEDSAAITGNTAATTGGGIYSDHGTVSLKDSARVSANTATWGGGINSVLGSVTLQDSATVSGNTATWGGGVYNYLAGASLTLKDSAAISGNTAINHGGGIFNWQGSITLNDFATVSGNTAINWFGGGIYNLGGSVALNDSAAVSGNAPDEIWP